MYHVTFNLVGKAWRTTLESRPHLVAPAVILQEGVWHGSSGPILYPAKELAKHPQTWNHKPILVGHDRVSPASIDARKIGILLNTRFERPKLRTEAWIDVTRCNLIDNRIIQNLEAGRPLECSTGLTGEYVPEAGIFNGKEFVAMLRDFQPDHLAILPDHTGACSLNDGCGCGVRNQAGDQGLDCDEHFDELPPWKFENPLGDEWPAEVVNADGTLGPWQFPNPLKRQR